ncbi:MAG: NAD(P)H-dependent oxidoreductase [Desulfobacterales bacterium]
MIIVDTALARRKAENRPIRVGLVGAGYMGAGIVRQIENHIDGMTVIAVSNRTVHKAEDAYKAAGINELVRVDTPEQLDNAASNRVRVVTDDPLVLCAAGNVDVIIEGTGEIEFGAKVVTAAIENRKHTIMMGAELDATVGPLLRTYADRAGVVISNTDGDQPGVMMNLYRFVKTIGYHPVLAGNIKGLQDYYRTPDTQREFARKNNLTAKMATAFADGTKMSMENAIVANATGFRTGKRGMYGPVCRHANDAASLFPVEQMLNGGLVDYILGAQPGPGVFVIGHNADETRADYMRYFKMGDGPFYVFYVPYHLPHLEAPLTVARAALFQDAAITPIGPPVCEVIAIAKRDLESGEVLDGIGGFTCYGVIENAPVRKAENLLPMGLSEGCRLIRNIKKDEPLTFDMIELPPDRLVNQLWEAQERHFNHAS